MSRIHLIISVTPIAGERDLEALCGEKVQQAKAIPLTEFEREQSSTIVFCKLCFGRQYFYAITEAQNAMNIQQGIEVA